MKLRTPNRPRYAPPMNRVMLFALTICLAFASIACGPPWKVVVQANPNPMAITNKFFLDAVSFDKLSIGGTDEQSWQSSKDAQAQASWQGDKQAMASEFSASFDEEREGVQRAGAAPGDFTIKPHITWIEPGFNAVVASKPTQVKIDVQILDAKGTLIDEFTSEAVIGASISNEALGTRLRQAGRYLGKVTAKYMKKRLGQ
ncbi:MAG: hypothetical protein ABI461_11400 [Polyangiaceae bacterium]